MGPGEIAFTVMPTGASSAERDLVSPINPSFDAEYADLLAVRLFDAIEEMLMIAQVLLFFFAARKRNGSAILELRNAPVRFAFIVSFHSSRVIFCNGFTGPPIPALFTRIE